MLHVVPAAAEEMARAAICSHRSSHMLRYTCQIHRGVGITMGRLHIGVCIVVTRKAINILCIIKIERRVSPVVPDMTFIATLFVRRNADAKIVEDVFLSDVTNATSFDVFLAFPIPMR